MRARRSSARPSVSRSRPMASVAPISTRLTLIRATWRSGRSTGISSNTVSMLKARTADDVRTGVLRAPGSAFAASLRMTDHDEPMPRAMRLLIASSLLAACQVGTVAEPIPPGSLVAPPGPSPHPQRPRPTVPYRPLSARRHPRLRRLSLQPSRRRLPSPSTCTKRATSSRSTRSSGASARASRWPTTWCSPTSATRYEDQQALWEMARDRYSSNSFNGANPRGWAAALNEIGIGPYELVSIPSTTRRCARRPPPSRHTGRPVGLVMWSGRHAWVMSGFESIGDPAIHAGLQPSPACACSTRSSRTAAARGDRRRSRTRSCRRTSWPTQFVIREPRRWSSELQAGYLLVLPTTASET